MYAWHICGPYMHHYIHTDINRRMQTYARTHISMRHIASPNITSYHITRTSFPLHTLDMLTTWPYIEIHGIPWDYIALHYIKLLYICCIEIEYIAFPHLHYINIETTMHFTSKLTTWVHARAHPRSLMHQKGLRKSFAKSCTPALVRQNTPFTRTTPWAVPYLYKVFTPGTRVNK